MNPDELRPPASKPDPCELQLLAFLRRHPQLRQRVLEMARCMEAEGAALNVHQIEDLVVEELRRLGQAALGDWASAQEQCSFAQASAEEGVQLHGKKNSTGKPPSGGSKSPSAS
jgi:hypothetical protein